MAAMADGDEFKWKPVGKGDGGGWVAVGRREVEVGDVIQVSRYDGGYQEARVTERAGPFTWRVETGGCEITYPGSDTGDMEWMLEELWRAGKAGLTASALMELMDMRWEDFRASWNRLRAEGRVRRLGAQTWYDPASHRERERKVWGITVRRMPIEEGDWDGRVRWVRQEIRNALQEGWGADQTRAWLYERVRRGAQVFNTAWRGLMADGEIEQIGRGWWLTELGEHRRAELEAAGQSGNPARV
jgi:hypothetical protein